MVHAGRDGDTAVMNPACTVAAVPGSAALAATTERLLGLLPTWFGFAEANAGYVAAAARLPGFTATAGREVVGVLLCQQHFPVAAEIHLMAVDPAWHRRGIGRALVSAAAARLTADGVRLRQVKTLGPSHPDTGYARARAFYRALGFLPLEEIHHLWPDSPCLMMIKPLR